MQVPWEHMPALIFSIFFRGGVNRIDGQNIGIFYIAGQWFLIWSIGVLSSKDIFILFIVPIDGVIKLDAKIFLNNSD